MCMERGEKLRSQLETSFAALGDEQYTTATIVRSIELRLGTTL